MPPKKALDQKKKKAVEDKTFGLKNKNKSKKVQQYVKSVETSVALAGQKAKDRRMEELRRQQKEAEKQAKEMAKKEQEALFKPVVNKTVVPAGVDPKSVVCEFYKAGKCMRGNKCKYSHDIEQARKVAKIDVYSDPRKLDTMDKWDQSKLEDVINKKQKGKMPPTEIICKYFLDAIENSVYGWFWECPNGADCHYRHCLPPGYVLKTKADREREKAGAEGEEEEETIEEQIEEERKKLDLSKCTPVTLESFKKWKADKEARRQAEVEKKVKDAEKKAAGSGMNVMSGRDLFRYDPSLFVDDEEAEEEYDIREQDGEEEEEDDEEEDDVNAKNYDSDAEEEEEEEERKDDEQKQASSSSSSSSNSTQQNGKVNGEEDSSVAKAASAIDESLFLDDTLPEDDDE